MITGRCRTCKQEIEWGVTPKGHRIPLDPGPRPDGNLRVNAAGVVIQIDPAVDHVPDTARRVSHFATCPDASRHRRKSGGAA